jgi:IclR family transcriptional regulator, pca regulon regulatory protein
MTSRDSELAAEGTERRRDDPTTTKARGSDFVQSLERGLAVIRAFGADHPSLTLSEVARATGLTRAATRRFLLTLVKLGYVRNDGREFWLRPRILELGYAYLSSLSLADIAQPHMEEFVAGVHESSSISVLDGDDIIYVVRVPAKRILTVAISVGTRFPAYCTSMGRVLLAFRRPDEIEDYLERVNLQARTPQTVVDRQELRAILHEVALTGYAVVDQELEPGLRSMAVPIHDRNRDVIAAMNVSVDALRVSREDLENDFLPMLQATAARIDADLHSARS